MSPFQIMLRPSHFAVWIALLILPAKVAGIQDLSAHDHWKDPSFIQHFMGSYGVQSETEPTISVEEKELFDQLIKTAAEDTSAAITLLTEALTTESSAALDFTLGNLNFQQDRLEEAANNYQDGLKKFPNFLRAHKNLGMTLFKSGRQSDAIPSFTKAIELGGEDGNLYGLLGHAYLQKGRHISAETAFRKALLFMPDYEAWQEGLASCLLQQGQFAEAVSLFNELLATNPGNPVYWLAQADALLGKGESKKAAVNYELVRRMDKATPSSLMNLGDIYLNQDLPARSLEAYAEVLNHPESVDLQRFFNRLTIVADKAEPQDVLDLFKSVQKQLGDKLRNDFDLKLLRLRSRVLLAQGKTTEAIPALEKILEQDPMDAETLIILGDHHSDNGQPERADLLFQRAGRVDGYAAKALVRRAQILVKARKYQAALPLLRHAQAIQPKQNVATYLDQLERLVKERE